MSFFAEDASIFLTGPIVKGKRSIRQWASGLMRGPWSTGRWQASEVEASRAGDLAYVIGSYQLAWNDPMGGTSTDRGKYLTVWKKQVDGTWKALIDTMNSDHLPPPPGIRD